MGTLFSSSKIDGPQDPVALSSEDGRKHGDEEVETHLEPAPSTRAKSSRTGSTLPAEDGRATLKTTWGQAKLPPGITLTPLDEDKPCAVVMINKSLNPCADMRNDRSIRSILFGAPFLTVPNGDTRSLEAFAAPPANASNIVGMENGFAVAVRMAYHYHLPLRLRPDHIWITILNSFGLFIEKNAKALRASFVMHEGKMDLCVGVPPAWETDDSLIEWEKVIGVGEICNLITENSQDDVTSAFESRFTTTDAVSLTASRIALMAGMKSYFNFSMETACGIRQVCLEGTLDDWTLLRARVARLADFPGVRDLIGHWFDKVDGVLLQLVRTYQNKPDKAWWSHIYTKNIVNGSGGGVYLSGWFLDLFLYSRHQELLHPKPTRRGDGSPGVARDVCIDEEDLPSGFVFVDFYWNLMSGDRRDFKLFTGSWHATLLEDGSIMPWLQWAVCEQKRKPAVPKQ